LVVDAVLSGVHSAGESHHELLRAFAADSVLTHAGRELESEGYRNHEFGDLVLIERARETAPAARDAFVAA
jgi:S-adenosylmethionine:tRNA ribosyltransferase-isomerase